MPEARYCIDCGKQCNGNRCRCCYISHHRVQPALPVTCLKCGKKFRRSSTNNYKASSPKYCSRACSFAALRDGERRTGRATVCLPRLTKELLAWFDGWEKDATAKTKKVAICRRRGCNARFYERSKTGRKRKYCSFGCANTYRLPWVLGCCKECERPVVAKSKTVFCKSCARKRNPSKHRKRCKKHGTHFNPHVRSMEVFKRDNWRCQLCFKKVSASVPNNHHLRATVDHIKPISRGGDHDWSNVQCLCRNCNTKKRNKRIGQARLF